MSTIEDLGSLFSDYHKELYGFRPRYGTEQDWADETWLRAEIARLDAAAPAIHAEEQAREQAAIADFEAFVASTIECGARTREEALRWIMSNSDCDGDWEYLCYKRGLPYGYFRKTA